MSEEEEDEDDEVEEEESPVKPTKKTNTKAKMDATKLKHAPPAKPTASSKANNRRQQMSGRLHAPTV